MNGSTAKQPDTLSQHSALLCWNCYGPVKQNEQVYDGHRFCSGSCAWNFYVTCPVCSATATDPTRGSELPKQCSEDPAHTWTHCEKTNGIVMDHKCGCQPLSPFEKEQKRTKKEAAAAGDEDSDPLDSMKWIMEADELRRLKPKFTVRSTTTEITQRVKQLRQQEALLKHAEQARCVAARLKARHPVGTDQPRGPVLAMAPVKQQQQLGIAPKS